MTLDLGILAVFTAPDALLCCCLSAAFDTQGAAKQVLAMRELSSWVTPTSGVLLVAGGTYALLTRLLPAV